jgi:DNA helicase-2/ATP-dependent DNA helicase PcrA
VEEIKKIGQTTPINLANLKALAQNLSSRAQIGWNEFLQIWQKMELVADGSPADLIFAVINSRYADYLEEEYPDYRERLQDLEQLANFADRRFKVEDGARETLQKFLAESSLQESFNARQAHGAGADGEEEKIVLSTIHQAKGLEWDAVFVINLSAGQFPSDRSLREDGGLEEERRLFYVAVTRARQHLYMTYPLAGGFNSLLGGPSKFLEELNRDLIEESGYSGGGGSIFTDFTDPSDGLDGIVYVSEDEPFKTLPPKKRGGFLSDIGDL